MALVSLDGIPLTLIGAPTRAGHLTLANLSSFVVDLANEFVAFIGQCWTSDGGTHTINNTGASSLGWRTNAVTFANAGTAVKIGLASVDLSNGPPARPQNSAGVVAYNVSRTLTGGGLTANAWQENTPDAGTMTISNGDLICFCVQMTARGGTDVINLGAATEPVMGTAMPQSTTYTPSTFTRAQAIPNCVITFNDGARGYFHAGYVQNGGVTTQTINNGSATKEIGNLFQFGFPVRVYGVAGQLTVSGNMDLTLYTNGLGVPVLQRSVSLLTVQQSLAGNVAQYWLFNTPLDVGPSEVIVVAVKPTTATNVSLTASPFASNVHQESVPGNGYGVSRTSLTGAFAWTNSGRDRMSIGLLVSGFSNPAQSRTMMGL